MSGFNWWRQRAILEPYVEQFFERVPAVFRERDKEFSSGYLREPFPGVPGGGGDPRTLRRGAALARRRPGAARAPPARCERRALAGDPLPPLRRILTG